MFYGQGKLRRILYHIQYTYMCVCMHPIYPFYIYHIHTNKQTQCHTVHARTVMYIEVCLLHVHSSLSLCLHVRGQTYFQGYTCHIGIEVLEQMRILQSYHYTGDLIILQGNPQDFHIPAEIPILKCFFLAKAEKYGSFHSHNVAENTNRGERCMQGTQGRVLSRQSRSVM